MLILTMSENEHPCSCPYTHSYSYSYPYSRSVIPYFEKQTPKFVHVVREENSAATGLHGNVLDISKNKSASAAHKRIPRVRSLKDLSECKTFYY